MRVCASHPHKTLDTNIAVAALCIITIITCDPCSAPRFLERVALAAIHSVIEFESCLANLIEDHELNCALTSPIDSMNWIQSMDWHLQNSIAYT